MIASTEPKSNTPPATFRKTDTGIQQLKRTPGLTRPQKAILSELHEHANGAGRCWPSIATICEGTGYSDRTIHKHIRGLEQLGLIEIEARTGASHRYQICYPAVDRGCSPIEYNRDSGRTGQQRAASVRRSSGEADRVAEASRSIEGVTRLAFFYGCSPAQVVYAVELTRRRNPDNFGAYLRAVLERHRNRESLLQPDRAAMMACRAELARLERQAA